MVKSLETRINTEDSKRACRGRHALCSMVALQPCNPCYASLGSATQNESAHCADPRLHGNRGLTWRRYFVTYVASPRGQILIYFLHKQ